MNLKEYDPITILDALERSGLSDLRGACDFADKIAEAVDQEGDVEELKKGFVAFRARKDYEEDHTSQPGHIHFHPLTGVDVCAPPREKTKLGRFNAPFQPVLYLSTTREVAIAETRALSTDTCTVATFETKCTIRLAKLLKKTGFPLGVLLSEIPSNEDYNKYLLYRTAEFVSRRVADSDRELHYRACTLIASAFKERGFDALAYRTSFWSNGWREEGTSEEEESIFASNIVLFDPQQAKPVRSSLFRIDWKRPSAKQDGNGYWKAKQ